MRSASQNDSIIVVTSWKDGSTDIIIPLHLNKKGVLDLENRVAGAYGKGHIDSIPGMNNENVLYTKNNEDVHQLLSKGVQFPQAMADDILAENMLPRYGWDVKYQRDDGPDIAAAYLRQMYEDNLRKDLVENSAGSDIITEKIFIHSGRAGGANRRKTVRVAAL